MASMLDTANTLSQQGPARLTGNPGVGNLAGQQVWGYQPRVGFAAVYGRIGVQFSVPIPSSTLDELGRLQNTGNELYAACCIAVRDADLRDNVKNITAPTLVISGTSDFPTPPSDGHFLQRTIPGARYLELAAAHISNQEQIVPFTDAVISFLGA